MRCVKTSSMRFTIRIILCLCVALVSGILPGRACSCVELKKFTLEDYLSYDVVLKGTVSSVTRKDYWVDTLDFGDTIVYTSFGGYFEVRVNVENNYKGFSDSVFVFETAAPDGVNCAHDFEKDEEWFFFAYKTKTGYGVGGCGWSERVKWQDEKLLKALKYVEEMAAVKQKYFRTLLWDKSMYEHRIYLAGLIINGKPEGKWTYAYHKTGAPYVYGNYKDGLMEGLWYSHFSTRYWRQGPVAAKTIYVQNTAVAKVRYSREGEIIDGWISDGYEIPPELFTEEEISVMKRKVY